jgi:hypothetical protein
MIRPAPWDDVCPDVDDLSRAELKAYLSQAPVLVRPLTDWQLEFCSSLLSYMKCGGRPSTRQRQVLDRGLLRQLWDNDPRLWE